MNIYRGLRSVIVSLLLALIFVISAYTYVQAQTTVRVHIGPVVIDVCPNILGLQTELPAGMIIDASGDCVTSPPPVVDVCNNIDGVQETIPIGYYRDTQGSCHLQSTPPVDVCPNILGLQSIVPSGLMVDEAGNCITPPVDECPNIDGPQSAIPLGMIKTEGICFTPVPTAPITPPSTTGGGTTTHGGAVPQPATPDYKNVPAVLDPVIEPLVNLVPEPIKEIVKSVPKEVAQTVPYYIYAILGLAAASLAIQALREIASTKVLLLLTKREKNLAEQKDNFMVLASHYLRTPLTLMSNGLDTIIALKEVPADALKPLKAAVADMDKNLSAILNDVENNEALKHINPPSVKPAETHVFRSLFFWGPVLGSVLLTLSANFLLGVVADVDLGTANLLFQVVMVVSVSMAFYSAVRSFHIHQKQRRKQQELLGHERIVDEARNTFIKQTTEALSTGLTNIYANRQLLGKASSARFFDDGYLRFNAMLEKFLLLGKLRGDRIHDLAPLNLKSVVNEVLASYKEQLEDKSITIENNVDPAIMTKQNKTLFEFIIRSIIDNAVKFNKEKGTIRIEANKDTKHFSISVTDSGIGIPRDKLSQIFQPFSRANSALQFDYEGLGFSLFLDKIITDYIGGSIAAASNQDHGTNIIVRTA